MKKKIFNKVVFLLDETGSMETIKTDTIGGFNTFLKTQKNSKMKINFTLTLFNSNKIEKKYINEPIENVKKLAEVDYEPAYLTPLWDAIGITINELPNKKNILFIILTDGEENSSKEFSLETIKNLIKVKEEQYNWKFLFLGADLSNFDDAAKVGITQYYSIPKKETKEMFDLISDTVNHYCKTGDVDFNNKNNVG